MIIQHNLTAMNAGRQYGIMDRIKTRHMEKLSSGYKINRAADDATGLSISEKMRRQIRGLTQGVANSEDGVSLCQVADGALAEVHDMIQRLGELSVKAANGTNIRNDDETPGFVDFSFYDRQTIQDEVDRLLVEINRISDTTKFNEIKLFATDILPPPVLSQLIA